ncbi:MAG: uroporphyrinogen decarboxylase family protein [Acidobacteriota bacterium]
MMSSRERVNLALNHQEADRIPLDLGGSVTSGMHVTTVYLLRQALKLDPPGTPVRVTEPYQMLGEIKPDLMEALGVDVVALGSNRTLFGFDNEGWKPWTFFDGTPVLVPKGFNTEPEPNGDILMYPEGDKSVPASARMPKNGLYFDAIIRQEPIDDSKLNVEDNLEEFGPISDEELAYFEREAERLYRETDKAILATFVGPDFGDIALVPGVSIKHPKGIRDVEEWYVSLATRRDYVYRIFERLCEIGLKNLEKLWPVVGDRVAVVQVAAADFGAQNGPFISLRAYRDLFKPFHKQWNDWIHRNTTWRTFFHSCGSMRALLPDFIEAGFEVFNPVQCSAAEMDPVGLKRDFGDHITFWGGGVDTQRTLPFGTPEDVRKELRERIRAFGPGGGFVFNTVHNVQARVPIENVLAMYESVREFGGYPVQ